jgi:hypothetical protein
MSLNNYFKVYRLLGIKRKIVNDTTVTQIEYRPGFLRAVIKGNQALVGHGKHT